MLRVDVHAVPDELIHPVRRLVLAEADGVHLRWDADSADLAGAELAAWQVATWFGAVEGTPADGGPVWRKRLMFQVIHNPMSNETIPVPDAGVPSSLVTITLPGDVDDC
jgi:hypothetical protein